MIKRLIIIIIAVLCTHSQCIAQTEPSVNEGKATVTVTDEDTGKEKAIEVEDAEAQARFKHSLAFEVLGRELTQREKDNYGDNLGKDDLKNILAG